ncbi:MAG: hypothetical protein R2879_15220 [Saprospiraceae bacterium]
MYRKGWVRQGRTQRDANRKGWGRQGRTQRDSAVPKGWSLFNEKSFNPFSYSNLQLLYRKAWVRLKRAQRDSAVPKGWSLFNEKSFKPSAIQTFNYCIAKDG